MNVLVSLVAVFLLVLMSFYGTQAGLHLVLGVVVPYVAFVLFLFGLIFKVVKWAKTPVPFRIPTSCGQQKSLSWIKHSKLDNPYTTLGTIGRMLLEVLTFRSLMRNTRLELHEGPKLAYSHTKWLWLAALVFHYSFLVILVRHMRFFTEPIPWLVSVVQSVDGFFQIGVPEIYITTFTLAGACAYLLLRRLWIPQVRYISLLSDYFPLILILSIGTTGFLMRHLVKTDIVEVKELMMGLITFNLSAFDPTRIHWLFYTHLLLVSVLFMYFPFSKLMHMAGVFLSPARNMANNTRAVRHINPWNYPVKVHTYEEYEDEFRDKMKAVGIPVDKE